MKKGILILIAVLLIATSCGNGSSNESSSSDEVTIGKQVWMTQNLNVDKFRNGDPIPEAKTEEEWARAGENKQPAWCYYENDPAIGAKYYESDPANGAYGKLYNWYAVNDPRGLAPEGWKIPSDEDWSRLTDFLGGENAAGTKMKSTDFWAESGNGTNESGFSGLPGGRRGSSGSFGSFYSFGDYGYWWSSTEDSTSNALWRSLNYINGDVNRNYTYKKDGLSVRCVKD